MSRARSNEQNADSIAAMIESGRTILILGDCLTESANSAGGTRETLLGGVRKRLLGVLGIEESAGDHKVPLGTLQSMAVRKASQPAAIATSSALSQKPLASPGSFDRLVSGPWRRIYDLTGRTILTRRPKLAKVDATRDPVIDRRKTQLVFLAGIYDRVDFSVPTGAENSERDIWFRQFSADIVSSPVLIMAESIHEELWQFLASRKGLATASTVSDAILVTSAVSALHKFQGELFGLRIVEGSIDGLAEEYLAPKASHLVQGRRSLAQMQDTDAASPGPRFVANLIASRRDAENEWRFLRGYDPLWSDVVAGRTVRLSRLREIYKTLRQTDGQRNIVLLKGRAGSGKTATLMQLGVELEAKGFTALWVDRSVDMSTAEIVDRVAEVKPTLFLLTT